MDMVQLVFRANTKALDDAQNKLNSVEKELGDVRKAQDQTASSMESGSKRAAGAVNLLTNSVKTLLLPLVTIASAVKFLNVAREAEVLQASLATATGSAQNAAVAFAALQKLASQTPYDLNQVTEGFTKLVNLGLDPSERAIKSYGNTASALGKDLNQMIEAVADASTGEFERLKEFGIRASKEGDRVKLTFRGVTTTVKNDAAEIEKYLIGLGEVEFAGAMEKRMQTLDGALSNLGDSFTKLATNIANSGVGSVIATLVRGAVAALDEINAWFESGQLRGYLDAAVVLWDNWTREIRTVINAVVGWLTSKWNEHSGFIARTVGQMIETWAYFPAQVRAFIQTAIVQVASFVDKVKAYGSAMAEYLNPFGRSTAEVTRDLNERLVMIDNVARDTIQAIEDDYKGVKQAVAEKIRAADAERLAWEKRNKAMRGDQLAQFGRGKGGATSLGSGGSGASKETKPGNGVTDLESWLENTRSKWGGENKWLEDLRRQGEQYARSQDELARSYRDLIDPMEQYRRKLAEIEQLRSEGRLTPDQAREANFNVQEQMQDELNRLAPPPKGPETFAEGWKSAFNRYTQDAGNAAKLAEGAFGAATRNMESALDDFVMTGKLNFKGLASAILADIAKMIAKWALLKGMKMAFGGGFADGGAFSMGSNITAFANGGVVGGPTFFGMSGGRTGLMGEAGPEAIMPLKRTSSGKLGVLAQGGGSQQVNNITVNVKVEGGSNPEQTANAVSMKLQEQFTRGIVRQEIQTWQRGQRYAV